MNIRPICKSCNLGYLAKVGDLSKLFCTKSGRSKVNLKKAGNVVEVEKLKKLSVANAILKYNYENKRLFGPILKRPKSLINGTPKLNENSSTGIVAGETGLKAVPAPVTSDKKTRHTRKIVSDKNVIISASAKEPEDAVRPPCNEAAAYSLNPIPEYHSGINATKFPLLLSDNSNKQVGAFTEKQLQLIAGHVVGIPSSRPSVTKILQMTMSEESVNVLERWRREMIAKLGEVGFAKYQKETFETGAVMHQTIQDYLSGKSITDASIDQRVAGHWKSIGHVLSQVSDVVMMEKKISHPYLLYNGVIDCVATFKNTQVLFEWKTSQKPKPLLKYTYDNPVQVAAYMGAINFNKASSLQINSAVLVIAYPSGEPANIHVMSPSICQTAWTEWLFRLQQYWQLASNKQLTAIQ